MIQISKEERAILHKYLSDEPIAKTKRKYYAPEVERVLSLLPNNPEAAALLAAMRKREAKLKEARKYKKACSEE